MDASYISELLGEMESSGLLETSDRGRAGSTLYVWDGDDALQEVDLTDKTHFVRLDQTFYLINIDVEEVDLE